MNEILVCRLIPHKIKAFCILLEAVEISPNETKSLKFCLTYKKSIERVLDFIFWNH